MLEHPIQCRQSLSQYTAVGAGPATYEKQQLLRLGVGRFILLRRCQREHDAVADLAYLEPARAATDARRHSTSSSLPRPLGCFHATGCLAGLCHGYISASEKKPNYSSLRSTFDRQRGILPPHSLRKRLSTGMGSGMG